MFLFRHYISNISKMTGLVGPPGHPVSVECQVLLVPGVREDLTAPKDPPGLLDPLEVMDLQDSKILLVHGDLETSVPVIIKRKRPVVQAEVQLQKMT